MDSNHRFPKSNQNAGKSPVKVDQEVFELIERAIKISKLTNGAFDISYASMDKIWKFDGSMKEMPTEEAIKNSVAKSWLSKYHFKRKRIDNFSKK